MVLKDWKKSKLDDSSQKYSWFNKKSKTYVTVFYLPRDWHNKLVDFPYSVSVEEVDDRDIIVDDFDKKFYNLKAALKFAKSYMRKH